ncbi:MAG: GntR family transcriptional regulator [Lachnospiraceae bacterium]
MKNQSHKYDLVLEELRTQIFNGTILPGEKLPSENELTNRYQVSRQTIRKALDLLQNEELIYKEHGRGTFCSNRKKIHNKSHNIGVVLTYLSDYIFPQVIQGLDQVFSEKGYSIILKNTRNSRTLEERCLEDLLSKNIDGLIIEPSKSQIFCRHMHLYQKLDEYKIPYVFIQGSYKQMCGHPTILMDDAKGGYLITRHLLESGHRSIIGIFKADDMQGIQRHKGYVKALQESGISYDPELVIWYHTEDRAVHPYQSIRLMAQNRQNLFFDGVVCYNDQIANAVIKALHENELDVPRDVSVTGYDNSSISRISGGGLTTIAHPQEKLGQIAAEVLLNLVQFGDEVLEQKVILIEPEIIIRESSAPKRYDDTKI